VKASFDAGWSLQHVKGSVAIQRVRLESDGVSGEEGGADDGVAEATVLELRVDNAVIYACLNLTKFNWLGAPGAGTPMALILKTCGTAAAFSAGRGASNSCTKPSKRGYLMTAAEMPARAAAYILHLLLLLLLLTCCICCSCCCSRSCFFCCCFCSCCCCLLAAAAPSAPRTQAASRRSDS